MRFFSTFMLLFSLFGTAAEARLELKPLLEACEKELKSMEGKTNSSGEELPTHDEWQKCLSGKGRSADYHEFAKYPAFKKQNEKNRKVREAYCKTISKEFKEYEFRPEFKAEKADCKRYAKEGIWRYPTYSVDQRPEGYGVFSRAFPGAPGDYVCARIRNQQKNDCELVDSRPQGFGAELPKAQKYCREFLAHLKRNPNEQCHRNLQFEGTISGMDFLKLVGAQSEQLCYAYANERLTSLFAYAVGGNDEYNRLNDLGLRIGISKGLWDSIELNLVRAENLPLMQEKLKKMQEKLKHDIKSPNFKHTNSCEKTAYAAAQKAVNVALGESGSSYKVRDSGRAARAEQEETQQGSSTSGAVSR